MRTLNLLSGVGVAIVAAWLAVTNLAYADEFTCVIPATGDTDCSLPKFSIPPQASLTIEVYSIRDDKGNNVDELIHFRVYDANQDNIIVGTIKQGLGTSLPWKYEGKEKPLTAQLRAYHEDYTKIIVRGRYTVTK